MEINHTFVIHPLNTGSMGEKLLYGPLETTFSCEVKRSARKKNDVTYCAKFKIGKRGNVCVATDVCDAAFAAFTSPGSGSFFRIKETHSSWPCKESKEFTI